MSSSDEETIEIVGSKVTNNNSFILNEKEETVESNYISYFQLSLVSIFFYYLSSILIFIYVEGASIIKAIYWTLTLNSQTNQVAKVFEDNEFTPKTNTGKMFSIIWIFFGFIVIGYGLGNLISYLIEKQEDYIKSQSMNQKDSKNKKSTMLFYMLMVLGALLFLSVLISTLIYQRYEKWNFIDAFYFAIITSVAVGESDYTPTSKISQFLGTIMVIISGLIFTTTLTILIDYISERAKQKVYDSVFNKKLSIAELKSMDENHDKVVTREEFLKYILVETHLVCEDKIKEIYTKFDELDKSKDGILTINDID